MKVGRNHNINPRSKPLLKHHHYKIFFICLLLFGALLVFLPLSYNFTRLQKELWNLGHACFFAFLFVLLPKTFVIFATFRPYKYFIYVFCISVLLGSAIELLQSFVPNRNVSLLDIYLNTIGALTGCSLYYITLNVAKSGCTIRKKQIVYPILLIFGVLAALFPSRILLFDEFVKHHQFPILSNFTYKSELTRWRGVGKKIQCVPNSQICGMSIDVVKQAYSGAFLEHPMQNWSEYDLFKITLWSPNKTKLTIRVHDLNHEKVPSHQSLSNKSSDAASTILEYDAFAYSDRFNKMISVHEGINEVYIHLDEIKNAPKTREMNLSEITTLGIFSSQPHQTSQLIIINAMLLRK